MPRNRPLYVEAFEDRHGKQRLYFRRGKGPRTPLPGPIGSDEFREAYAKALAGEVTAAKPAPAGAKAEQGRANAANPPATTPGTQQLGPRELIERGAQEFAEERRGTVARALDHRDVLPQAVEATSAVPTPKRRWRRAR